MFIYDFKSQRIKQKIYILNGRFVMRSESEMINLIINIAKTDERVRAAIMRGSRTNPNATVDRFQDFDI